jgi:hypothetical protein
VLRVRIACPWALVDGRQPHPRHQAPYPPTPDCMEGDRGVVPFGGCHTKGGRGTRRRSPPSAPASRSPPASAHSKRRPADRHQPALRRDRQAGMLPLDHLPPSHDAHRANPFDKKSRSTTNCPILACNFSISVSLAALLASVPPEKSLPCRRSPAASMSRSSSDECRASPPAPPASVRPGSPQRHLGLELNRIPLPRRLHCRPSLTSGIA